MPHTRQFSRRVVLFLGQPVRCWAWCRFLLRLAEVRKLLAATPRALRQALNFERTPHRSVAVFAVMSAPWFMPRMEARRGPIEKWRGFSVRTKKSFGCGGGFQPVKC